MNAWRASIEPGGDAGARRWIGRIVLALGLLLLWQVPWLGWLVYPFQLLGTFVHELCHGFAAELTGGDFLRFSVSADLSGKATSAGGWRWVVASAGYVGSAVAGGLLIAVESRVPRPRVLLWLIAIVFAIACLWFLRNAFGLLAAVLMGSALFLAAAKLSDRMASWLLDLIALQLVFDGYRSLWTVMQVAGLPDVNSDANTMARLSGLPASLWVVFWMLLSTAVLILSIRYALRHSRAVTA